jgi:hypothetical protein
MDALVVLAGLGLAVVVVMVATWKGFYIGPALLGLAFAGLAWFFLSAGFALLGGIYAAGGAAEAGATIAYLRTEDRDAGPSASWRLGATVIGLTGVIGFSAIFIYALLQFLAWIGSLG